MYNFVFQGKNMKIGAHLSLKKHDTYRNTQEKGQKCDLFHKKQE